MCNKHPTTAPIAIHTPSGIILHSSCDIAFMASTVTIHHNNNIILQGSCTPASKLWELDIQPPAPAHANAAIGSASPANLVAFAHATLYSPALSTVEDALQCSHYLRLQD